MKKIILLFTVLLFITFDLVNATEFVDMVSESHWAFTALNYACEEKLIQGFEDSTIRPNAPLTRAQMAAIIVRKYGNGTKGDLSEYADISPDAWHYDYFSEAVAMGLFFGNGNGIMNPERNISRQEAFVVIGRMLKLQGLPGETLFKDNSSIAEWAKELIKALQDKKYILGDEYQRINPVSEITRAEFAQLLYNINEKNNISEKLPVHKLENTGGSVQSGFSGGNTTTSEKIENVENTSGFLDGDNYSKDIFDD